MDVSSGLLEGLSLRNLSGVMGTDSDDVGAEEDEDVSAHLARTERKGEDTVKLWMRNNGEKLI